MIWWLADCGNMGDVVSVPDSNEENDASTGANEQGGPEATCSETHPTEERELRQVVKHTNRKEKGRRNHRGVNDIMNQGNRRWWFGRETQHPARENEYRSRANKRPNR